MGRVRRLAEQAAAEADRVPDRLERVGRQFLRHEADLGARRAVIALTMSWPSAVTVPVVGVTMPQTMLISVVLPAPFGPEQREDLAAMDVEIDGLQRLKAGRVGFRDIADDDSMVGMSAAPAHAAAGSINVLLITSLPDLRRASTYSRTHRSRWAER